MPLYAGRRGCLATNPADRRTMAFLYEMVKLADSWKSSYERMILSIVRLGQSDNADPLGGVDGFFRWI